MGTTNINEGYRIPYAKNPNQDNNEENNQINNLNISKEKESEKQKENENEKVSKKGDINEKEEEIEKKNDKESEKEIDKDSEKQNEKNSGNKSDNDKNSEKEKRSEIDNKYSIKKEEKQKKITVKIKMENINEFWEKEYDIDTPLNLVEIDFIEMEENNNEKNQINNYIEYTYNNSLLQFDSRPLKSLIIDEDQKEILIIQEIKHIKNDKKLEKKKNIEYVNYIGKPMANPFEIYIFIVKNKIIKKLKYKKEKINKLELDKYGTSSTYCNGINHLFISGGIDPISNQTLNLFWDIDIENNILKKKIRMPIPKKNHSMIYYNGIVYIIGGDDEKTMIYDTKNLRIEEWVNLNQKKFEPSLIIYNNFLFCIDSSRKYYSDYNFEKINLINENEEWENIKPKINSDISDSIFSQRFFGLLEDNNENIIFLGGIYDNDNDNSNLNYNLQYNVDKNLIGKNEGMKLINIDDIKDLKFNEKSFLYSDDNTSIILPEFNKRNPKILYYHKNENCLEANIYHSNKKLTKIYKDGKIGSMKESLVGLNINMPTIKNNNIYSNIQNNQKTLEDNLDKKSIEKQPNLNNINIIHSTKENMNNISVEQKESDNDNKSNKVNKEKTSINNTKSNKEIENNLNKSKDIGKESKNSNNSENNEIEKGSTTKREIEPIDNTVKISNGNNIPINNTPTKVEIKTEQINKENTINLRDKETAHDIFLGTNDSNTYFHSSVNFNLINNFDKLDNNKAIKNRFKKKYLIQPQDMDVKFLKKARRQFKTFENNEFKDYTNY